MSASGLNPKVDAYIANSAEFARPILEHVRGLVHKACPRVVEEIKWSRPFFVYNGEILANLSAFKQHCSFGFWGAEIGKELKQDGVDTGGRHGLSRQDHKHSRTCRPTSRCSPTSAAPST